MKLFDTNKIYETYNKYIVKSDNYYSRFSSLDKYFSLDELEAYSNIDTPRLASLVDFKEWIAKYDLKKGNKLLYTSGSDPELNYIEYQTSKLAEYPPYDLHTIDLKTYDYDFVIFNQTLEHTYNPFIVVQNLYNHIANNGFVYTTVPTINIPHMTPIHFWGITPIGLCLLMMSVGFEIAECGFWGNSEYINYIFNNNTWPGYKKVLDNNSKLNYDPVCQAQTWVLAKKVEQ